MVLEKLKEENVARGSYSRFDYLQLYDSLNYISHLLYNFIVLHLLSRILIYIKNLDLL